MNSRMITFVICLLSVTTIQLHAQAADSVTTDSVPRTSIIGLEIIGFVENSNLEKTGAKIGDLLTHYNGVKLESLSQLLELRDSFDKDLVEIVLLRGSEESIFTIPKGMLGANLQEVAADHKVDKDAVIIEGIGPLGWGLSMENSFLGCVTMLEAKYGSKSAYSDILGLSGYGFRLHFFKNFCPSSPDATCGRSVGGEILKNLGYEYIIYSIPDSIKASKAERPKEEARLRAIIKECIDKGWPVLAIDLIDVAEWGLITGYQKNGDELFCRTYFDKTRGYEIAQKFPWVIFVITGKRDVDKDDLFYASLEVAKELYTNKEYGAYANGINGIRTWIQSLGDEKLFNDLNDKKLYDAMHANWWIYYSLVEARALNAVYLSANVLKFNIDKKTIEDLVKLMEKETELLKNGFNHVPSIWENKDASVWTLDKRKNQVKVLTKFLKMEEQVSKLLNKKIE